MGRRKPTLIFERTNNDQKTWQVLEAEVLYTLEYQHKPFGLKVVDEITEHVKYKKLAWVNRAHAEREAAKLNEMFKTADFKVVERR